MKTETISQKKINYEIHDTTDCYAKQWRECDETEANEKITLAAEYAEKTIEEIEKMLADGQSISYKKQPNYYYTHGTDKIRKFRVPPPPPEMKKCDCGHTVPKYLVMSASMGSCCPRCYDRMS